MVSLNKKPFLIAEISANHCGSIKIAKKLIDDAKKYGADAVKFQTFSPETMTLNSHKKDFLIKEGIWKGNNLWKFVNVVEGEPDKPWIQNWEWIRNRRADVQGFCKMCLKCLDVSVLV